MAKSDSTSTTMRALTKAAPAACVAAGVPASTAPGETKIAALYQAWGAARCGTNRLEAECEAALNRFIKIKLPVPDELVWKSGADALALPPRAAHETWVDNAGNDVAYLTSFYWTRRVEDQEKNGLDPQHERKSLARVKQYEATLSAAREKSGLDAAEDALDAHMEVVWALESDLARASPTSLADVRLKAIAVKRWCDDVSTEHIVEELLDSLIALAEATAA